MSQADEKRQQLERRVISKVHWGAREAEIMEWLEENQGITGDQALHLWKAACKARRNSVRKRAIITLIFSTVAMLFTIPAVVLRIIGEIVTFRGFVFVIGLALVSIACFIRSIYQIATGHSSAPMD